MSTEAQRLMKLAGKKQDVTVAGKVWKNAVKNVVFTSPDGSNRVGLGKQARGTKFDWFDMGTGNRSSNWRTLGSRETAKEIDRLIAEGWKVDDRTADDAA